MPTYTGTAAANVFVAPTEEDWEIIGKGGADTLTGNAGDDIIDGGTGNDILNGGGGNDMFVVGVKGGNDQYNGGDTSFEGADGFDVITAVAPNVVIGIESITGIEEISAGGFANVTVRGSNNANVLDLRNTVLTGISFVEIRNVANRIVEIVAAVDGGNGDDTINGHLTNANYLNGGTGNDTLTGGSANDIFYFGVNAGADSIDGGAGLDTLQASIENARIILTGANPLVGVEAITGGTFSNIQIWGTKTDDVMDFSDITLTRIANIFGDQGNDIITGSIGNDTLDGGADDDIIYGGLGSDTFYGGAGFDVLNGGAGDDSFYISAGADQYFGGTGYDTIYAAANNATLQLDTGKLKSIQEISANGFTGVKIGAANSEGSTIDLSGIFLTQGDIYGIYGSAGNDSIFGSSTYDYIYGGNGDDIVDGKTSDDTVHGGGGADMVYGGAGYDTLYGDSGNDTLFGGAKDDTLYGGTGDDTFIVTSGGGFDSYFGNDEDSTDNDFDLIQAADNVKTIGFASKTAFVSGVSTIRNAVTGIDEIRWDGTNQVQLKGSFSRDFLDFSNVVLTGVSKITGEFGNDTIVGSALGDRIDGGQGLDILNGGLGSDTIIGNLGIDSLTGGADNDIFSGTAAWLEGDTITDLSVGDRIAVTNGGDVSRVAITYTDNGSGTGGNLSITGVGGLKPGLDITLVGSFTTEDFIFASDGAKGVYIALDGTPLL